MKIVTINIPDQYLDAIEGLVNLGQYPSRSEVVRAALHRFFRSDPPFLEALQGPMQQFQTQKEKIHPKPPVGGILPP